ncbi:MAG TPA: hypothetical protein VEW72_08375 [Burkholderiales bacterium]|nr:hypothetical protein [Burkholderiales bacterium]
MSTSVFTWLLASCVTTLIPAARACFKTSSSASGEFGTNRDSVGLLRNQLPNDLDLLLRISVVRAHHGGVNPILRGKLFDPFLHALQPPEASSLDDRDNPYFLRLPIVSVVLAACSTYRR